jgi:hypothetical protein
MTVSIGKFAASGSPWLSTTLPCESIPDVSSRRSKLSCEDDMRSHKRSRPRDVHIYIYPQARRLKLFAQFIYRAEMTEYALRVVRYGFKSNWCTLLILYEPVGCRLTRSSIHPIFRRTGKPVFVLINHMRPHLSSLPPFLPLPLPPPSFFNVHLVRSRNGRPPDRHSDRRA